MGDLEMDLESMLGGDGAVSGGDKTTQPTAEVLSVIEQSSRALQQMGLILSKTDSCIDIIFLVCSVATCCQVFRDNFDLSDVLKFISVLMSSILNFYPA